MRLYLAELRLALKRREEIIPFHDFSYFYGQMGAGKTSIARLVDYCLGGELELSPALQSEFVAATLALEIEGVRLFVERQRDSDRVRAAWSKDEAFEVVLPVRHPAGVVIKDTDVETLSDLIYHLAGMQPPRVRRSKERDDSDLGRLSIRDLLWYCYLDQDEIDSSFFHLEQGGHPFKRLKSRDVLRFVLGYHQERVAALESELEETRFRRLAVSMGALSLERALKEVGVSSEQDIEARANGLEGELREVATTIRNARDAASAEAPAHGTDTLRERARFLSADLASVQESLVAIERAIASDTRHLHEIQTLSLKIRRSTAARAVLEGVAFVSCPRCAQKLPDRPASDCSVCGQDDTDIDTGEPKNDVVAQDARARIAELTDALARHHIQLRRARSESEALSHSKAATERELSEALRDYDSVYLSTALIAERRGATLTEQIAQLNGLRRLPEAVTRQRQEAAALAGREAEIRSHTARRA